MPLTRDQACEALDQRGISISEFSRAYDLNTNLVSDLLAGREKGRSGSRARRPATEIDGWIEEAQHNTENGFQAAPRTHFAQAGQ
ncbi:hypothetical protein [Halomonas sp. BC04]|uniref:hypothetical protein n=1 Tax=Halomonas sp. BC04 TaxID=1403540 RepID=UPI0003ED73DC|nr:hypothetical protein [Halomonas sp. BC04]EWH01270.1 hypothetical protein Q427_14950 [Halomonas sp. BC04]